MLKIQSPAFEHAGRIPPRYTADGQDTSPPLSWIGAPPDTAELVLIMDDPDAPGSEPWVHWLVYHIPPELDQLPEGIRRERTPADPAGVAQGCNSWRRDNIGYRGPAPPERNGDHHYRLRLFALDKQLDLPPAVDKSTLKDAMQGHVIADAELVGVYQR